jgi:hypothetical protein
MFIVPPSIPGNLLVDTIGDTWVYVRWQHPSMHNEREISRYDVFVQTYHDISIQSTTTNQTYLNVTGLQPNVEYSFRTRGETTVYGVPFVGGLSDAGVAMTLGKNISY